MAVHVEVDTTLDDRSINATAGDLRSRYERLGNDAGDAFATGWERSAPRVQKAYEKAYAGVEKAASSVRAAEAQVLATRERAEKVGQALEAAEQKVTAARNLGAAGVNSLKKAEEELADVRRAASIALTQLQVRAESATRAHITEQSAIRDLSSAYQSVSHDFESVGSSASSAAKGMSSFGQEIGNVGAGLSGLGPAGIGLLAVGLTELAGVAVYASGALGLIPAALGGAAAAFGTFKLATSGFDQAIKDIDDRKKFAKDLADLSPIAQQAALSIQQLMPAFDQLKHATQDAFFVGVGPQLKALTTQLLPVVQQATTGIASAMNQAFSGITTQLLTPQTKADIQGFVTNITSAFHALEPAVAPVTRAFAEIANVSSSFLPQLATEIANAATQFGNFITNASKTGELKHWIQDGVDAMHQLVQIGGDLTQMFIALGPSGKQTMQDIVTGVRDVSVAVRILTGDFGALKDAIPSIGDVATSVFNRVNSAIDSLILGPLRAIISVANHFGAGIPEIPHLETATTQQQSPFPGIPGGSTPGGINRTSLPTSGLDPALTGVSTIPLPGGVAPSGVGSGTRIYLPGGATDSKASGWGPGGGFLYNPDAKLPKDKAAKTPKLPGEPQVPYDQTLPQGYGNLPQTEQIVSAENSWMDARHTLAEKQARLNQLEKDNNATADEITKARNDVIQAQQGQQQAELRLETARAELYKKSTQQSESLQKGMDQIGVGLDKDLGISKGLAGIADNFVRFVGSLALAPLEAKLNAISNAPGQAQGGFGAIGIAGAQGAFGPEYTAAGQAAAAASSSATPSYNTPDIGSPSNPADLVAAGGRVGALYSLAQSMVGTPYSTALRNDCSGMVSKLATAAVGLQPTAAFSTANEGDWLASHGFQPGLGGSGDLNIGWYNGGPGGGHTAATLPGGVHAEQGGSTPGDSFTLGPSAAGAENPEFSNHAHLPMGGDGASLADYGGGSPGASGLGSGIPIPLPVTIVGGAGDLSGGGSGAGFGSSSGASPPATTPGPAAPSAPGRPASAGTPPGWTWNTVPGGGPNGGIWTSPQGYYLNPGQRGAPPAPGGGAPTPGSGGPAPGPGFSWGGPTGAPNVIPGSAGQGYTGAGFAPKAGEAAGAGLAPTQIGGVEPPTGSGKGGIGITPGGSIDTALGVAASAFPGLGQAAQTGVKLANRAIQFGGQAAAIGVQGLEQTFLPTGGSKLAENSWFSKILGGLAGAAPALPNMAGKKAAAPDKKGGEGGGGEQKQGGGDTHITVNNQRATEDGTGRDIAYHAQQMYQPAGQP